MSLKLVQEVSKENPDLLPQNLGRTCYRHTFLLIEKLRALGHDASFICKSPGEGQYVPPGFETRFVIGLDGKPYACSGVSHDAIWCDGKQFDTIVAANEHDRPIYKIPNSTDVSFDPASGPQITASTTWDEIPAEKWRNNNPPLTKSATPIPPQTQPKQPTPKIKSRDEFFPQLMEVNDFYSSREGLNRAGGMVIMRNVRGKDVPTADVEALGAWGYDLMTGKTVEQIKTAIRMIPGGEWQQKHLGETPF